MCQTKCQRAELLKLYNAAKIRPRGCDQSFILLKPKTLFYPSQSIDVIFISFQSILEGLGESQRWREDRIEISITNWGSVDFLWTLKRDSIFITGRRFYDLPMSRLFDKTNVTIRDSTKGTLFDRLSFFSITMIENNTRNNSQFSFSDAKKIWARVPQSDDHRRKVNMCDCFSKMLLRWSKQVDYYQVWITMAS